MPAAIADERVFLARLQDEVIHDNARLTAFLATLHKPIYVEPGFGFCRFGGERWGYVYQLCVSSRGNPPGCPFGSFTVEYLGPQSRLSILNKDYHDGETMFRYAIIHIDKDGKVCSDIRKMG
ncbi:MAG: hypothetical protein ABI832_23655 [bacterium]